MVLKIFRRILGISRKKPGPGPIEELVNARARRADHLALATVAPPPDPVAAPPPAPLPGRVARIVVVLPLDRGAPGTLRALDPQGNILSGPWPALGRADSRLADTRGNPSRDPLHPFGDTPTGEFEVVGHFPAHEEPQFRELFGVLGALSLRAVSGQALEADGNGRTQLLIHGGSDHEVPTDGSIRIPDEAIAELLSLLPANPGTARPRIRVAVSEAEPELANWSPRRAVQSGARSSAGASSYAASRGSSGSSRTETRSAAAVSPSYDPWSGYYWWYVMNGASTDVLRDPICHEQPQPGPDQHQNWRTEGDRSASEGLSALGYAVQNDGDLPRDEPPEPSPAPITDQHAQPSQAPDHEPSGGSSDWAPSGNAYDR